MDESTDAILKHCGHQVLKCRGCIAITVRKVCAADADTRLNERGAQELLLFLCKLDTSLYVI